MIKWHFVSEAKMNEIANNLLLAGDKAMAELYLSLHGFIYIVCGPFTKNKKRLQKFIETGDSVFIYQNELDKTFFQHDVAFGDFESLPRTAAFDKVIWGKSIYYC